MLPLGAGLAVASPLSGRLVGRVGARLPMLAGLVVAGLAMLGLLALQADTSPWAVAWVFALVGAGAGLCMTPMTTTAVAAVHHSRAGMASAVYNAMRQLGQVLGVAVLGTLVFGAVADDPPPGASGALAPAAGRAFTGGLHDAVTLAGAVLLAAAALVAWLVPGRAQAAAAAG